MCKITVLGTIFLVGKCTYYILFCRIHVSSKEAQLKILNILGMNGAPFYEKIHFEYYSILIKLVQYYKDNTDPNHSVELKLENFISEQIDIQNLQLNLEPIFVAVNDIKTCKILIDFTLQLLSRSVPINSLHIAKTKTKHEELFNAILFMLQNFSTDAKLVSFIFFSNLIMNYNQVAVFKFQMIFPNIFREILNCLEAVVKTIEVLHDKGEISMIYLDKFNDVTSNLLTLIESRYDNEYEQALLTICTTILQTKSKVFSKDLKLYCLSLSNILQFPQDITGIKNRDASEIEKLSNYYYTNIMAHVANIAERTEHLPLSYSWHYCQVSDVIWDSIMACCEKNDDKILISYHLERCWVVLTILQKVQVNMQVLFNGTDGRTHCESLLQKKPCLDGLAILLKLMSERTDDFLQDYKHLKLGLDSIFSITFPYGYCTQLETIIQIFDILYGHLTSVNKEYFDKNKENIDTLVLKYILALKLHIKFDSEEKNQKILSLIYSLNERKTTNLCTEVSSSGW